MDAQIDYKIEGVIPVKEYKAMPWGRRLEHDVKIRDFKAGAKSASRRPRLFVSSKS